MNYIKSNKEAWEEAFENRSKEWGKDIALRLQNEEYPFLESNFIKELQKLDFNDKTIGQFCCNNGRELLSIMKFGAKQGVGFDIAENMIDSANTVAKQLGANCSFVQSNILEIDENFHNYFDYIVITIGAITWFEDLEMFFKKVALCLKEGGKVLIHEIHPVTNMIATKSEELYDPNVPKKLTYSYFRKEPWIEDTGMGYMTKKAYKSKTFYSYSHTFSDIINGLSQNNLIINNMQEFDCDLSSQFTHLNNQAIPLSYILIAKKVL